MIYEPFPLKFRGSKKTHYGPRTTDRPSYRDAWTHLKRMRDGRTDRLTDQWTDEQTDPHSMSFPLEFRGLRGNVKHGKSETKFVIIKQKKSRQLNII